VSTLDEHVSENEAISMKEKAADITLFAMVRNTCAKSELPPRFSELYGCSWAKSLQQLIK
jgi:hypothetical protein